METDGATNGTPGAANASATNDPTATPQAGVIPSSTDGNNPTGQAPATSADDTPKTLDDALKALARLQREVTDTRKEAAGYRVKARDYEQAQQAAAQAQMTDLERANAATAAAEAQAASLKDRFVSSSIAAAATKLGIVDPEVAAQLVKGSLEFDADGMPTNADAALKRLLREKPYLAPQPSTSPGNAGRDAQGLPTFNESQLADPEFYSKNHAAIMAAIAQGRIIRGK